MGFEGGDARVNMLPAKIPKASKKPVRSSKAVRANRQKENYTYASHSPFGHVWSIGDLEKLICVSRRRILIRCDQAASVKRRGSKSAIRYVPVRGREQKLGGARPPRAAAAAPRGAPRGRAPDLRTGAVGEGRRGERRAGKFYRLVLMCIGANACK